jgi:hypothetical protein
LPSEKQEEQTKSRAPAADEIRIHTGFQTWLAGLDVSMLGVLQEVGRTEYADLFFAADRKKEKRGVPRLHGKHAAWELLSPDLRCFCKQLCGKSVDKARVHK